MHAKTAATKKTRSPKRPDPVSEAAGALVGALEAHRATGFGWLTLSQLIERVPGLTTEFADTALLKNPAKRRIVVAFAADPSSPAVLKEDVESIAQDGELLKTLAHRGCSANAPVRPLVELTQPLEKTLKKLVENYWPKNTERLPAELSPMLVGSGKKKLFAIHDEQFPLPEVELSRKLVAALLAQRAAAEHLYPSTWPALLESIGDHSHEDLIRRATAQTPFADRVREVPTNGAVWIAFAEDVPTIVASESLLRRLVLESCSAEKAEVKLSVLAKQLPKDLQRQFIDTWQMRLEQKAEIDFALIQAAGTAKKRDVLFRDRRFPPADVALAENLVNLLISQKKVGGTSYPTTWHRLIELTEMPTTQAVRDKAIQLEPFRSRVVVSFAKDPNAPLSLAGDEALLANSPALLSTVLASIRTDDNHAVVIDKIVNHKGIHPAVKPHFQIAIERRIADKHPPAGIGALRVGKKWSLFRLSDVIGTNSESTMPTKQSVAPNSVPTAECPFNVDSEGFARDFDAAFAKLDGKLGLPRYASLVDLRPALKQYPRDLFDRELLKLRQAGRYSLSLVEGRFGLSDDERAACLVVDNVPHLLVHKK